MRKNLECDFLIIGSGFGGSVSAMRLAEKGYRVIVLEKGRAYKSTDFAKSNLHARKYLWAPLFRCFGIQAIKLLPGVMIFHGVGVGGGSLVYANTLMQPKKEIFDATDWPAGLGDELTPHFQSARQMLGVTQNPHLERAENLLQKLGEDMGVANTFHATDVGVFFGAAGVTVKDPYFKGLGPDRTGCTLCGACMIGCRVGAKNTLDKNYLHLAQHFGTQIIPEHEATRITPTATGYRVETKITTAWWRKRGPSIEARRVILAAGVLGTMDLLLKNRDQYRSLPLVSPKLGEKVRTNGESFVAVSDLKTPGDLAKGIAIGAAIHPDAVTKIEHVRYPAGANAMRPLAFPMMLNPRFPAASMLWATLKKFPDFMRFLFMRDWAANTVILLVMQSSDTFLKMTLARNIYTLFRKKLSAASSAHMPRFLPVAQRAVAHLAQRMPGYPQNIASEVLLGIPATAHILGGACFGRDASDGVINNVHEVFHYPGLYVCDASVISSNLGVNPSLTISALAERFAAKFPAKNTPL